MDRVSHVGHRHRHEPRTNPEALSGLHPGRCLDHAQVRRHRPGAGPHAPLLSDDGRRRDRAQRAGRGQRLHHHAARRRRRSEARSLRRGRKRSSERRGRRWRRTAAARQKLRAGHRRRPEAARPDATLPEQGGLLRPHRRRWRGRAAAGATIAAGGHHAGRDDARHGRLERALGAEGRRRTVRHPGHHADDGGRPQAGLHAGRLRLRHQAGGPPSPVADPQEIRLPEPAVPGPPRRGRSRDPRGDARDSGKGRLESQRGQERTCGTRVHGAGSPQPDLDGPDRGPKWMASSSPPRCASTMSGDRFPSWF